MNRTACFQTSKHYCECNGQGDKAIESKDEGHGQTRWYITMFHAGFNSPANNAWGYATEAQARGAIKRYQNRGAKARAQREGK